MGKFIARGAYTKKTERSQINELMLHFKQINQNKQIPKQAEGMK
jgi:hypothetical protein